MHVRVQIEGINLEKLLRAAGAEGIVILAARRTGTRQMRLCVRMDQWPCLRALCERYGWSYAVLRSGRLLALKALLLRRFMLAPAALLGIALVFLSSQMVLAVRIEYAQSHTAQVSRVLSELGVRPGRMKSALSLDALRAQLAYRLPGLSFAGLRFEGSVLVCDGRQAVLGEDLSVAGSGNDIVAAQSGVITRISASSGTPLVEPGQAVHKGQVLIAASERTQKGETVLARAQGQVLARVYASGAAKVSLHQLQTVETGSMRTRVSVASPWHRREVQRAEPFSSQDVSREIQPVVGLYLPLWREIETLAETQVFSRPRDRAEAASIAQGAAEKIAKDQCPYGVLILDKRVNYSMIDNEFVYARVVLEYEASIAGRIK